MSALLRGQRVIVARTLTAVDLFFFPLLSRDDTSARLCGELDADLSVSGPEALPVSYTYCVLVWALHTQCLGLGT